MNTSPKVQKSSISEIWKPIEGFEGLYEISNKGRVKSLPKRSKHNYGGIRISKERILKGGATNGYIRVTLCKNERKKAFSISRLVAAHFLPVNDRGNIIRYKDGNSFNNSADNLEWEYSEREWLKSQKKVEPLQLEGEIWKPIDGHEGKYEISNLGRVKGLPREKKYKSGRIDLIGERILKNPLSSGYKVANLFCEQRKQIPIHVHRLVAIAFIPNLENKPHINHIDGNKLNNDISNLEWCTPKENAVHAHETGLSTYKGEKHHLTPFTKEEILSIREEYKDPNTSHRDLARKYGVEKTTIGNIIRKKTWKHV